MCRHGWAWLGETPFSLVVVVRRGVSWPFDYVARAQSVTFNHCRRVDGWKRKARGGKEKDNQCAAAATGAESNANEPGALTARSPDTT